jgi:hypothetical protein
MMKKAGGIRGMSAAEGEITDLDQIQMILANPVHRTEEAGKEKIEKKRGVHIMDLIILIIQNDQNFIMILPDLIWIDNILYGLYNGIISNNNLFFYSKSKIFLFFILFIV